MGTIRLVTCKFRKPGRTITRTMTTNHHNPPPPPPPPKHYYQHPRHHYLHRDHYEKPYEKDQCHADRGDQDPTKGLGFGMERPPNPNAIVQNLCNQQSLLRSRGLPEVVRNTRATRSANTKCKAPKVTLGIGSVIKTCQPCGTCVPCLLKPSARSNLQLDCSTLPLHRGFTVQIRVVPGRWSSSLWSYWMW